MLQQRLCRAEIKSTYQINRSFMGPWHGIVFFSWVVFFSPNSATKPSKPLAWGATVPVAKGCATWTNWAVASSMDGEPSLLGEPWAHTNPPLFASRLSTTTWFPRLAGPFFFPPPVRHPPAPTWIWSLKMGNMDTCCRGGLSFGKYIGSLVDY